MGKPSKKSPGKGEDYDDETKDVFVSNDKIFTSFKGKTITVAEFLERIAQGEKGQVIKLTGKELGDIMQQVMDTTPLPPPKICPLCHQEVPELVSHPMGNKELWICPTCNGSK